MALQSESSSSRRRRRFFFLLTFEKKKRSQTKPKKRIKKGVILFYHRVDRARLLSCCNLRRGTGICVFYSIEVLGRTYRVRREEAKAMLLTMNAMMTLMKKKTLFATRTVASTFAFCFFCFFLLNPMLFSFLFLLLNKKRSARLLSPSLPSLHLGHAACPQPPPPSLSRSPSTATSSGRSAPGSRSRRGATTSTRRASALSHLPTSATPGGSSRSSRGRGRTRLGW